MLEADGLAPSGQAVTLFLFGRTKGVGIAATPTEGPMRPYLLAGLLCLGLSSFLPAAPLPGPPELKKLHVLVVFDTSSNLDPSLRIDYGNLEGLLKDKIPPERMTLKIL